MHQDLMRVRAGMSYPLQSLLKYHCPWTPLSNGLQPAQGLRASTPAALLSPHRMLTMTSYTYLKHAQTPALKHASRAILCSHGKWVQLAADMVDDCWTTAWIILVCG